MFSKDTLHAWSVVLLASFAAGTAAAVPEFPQYAGLLVPLAAALATFAGKVTQMARNAQPPESKNTPPSVTGIVFLILVCCGLMSGCSRFMHFSDPSLDDIASEFCNDYKSAHMADFQSQVKEGITLDDILHDFDVACLLRVKQAGPAGMGAVQMKIQGELQK